MRKTVLLIASLAAASAIYGQINATAKEPLQIAALAPAATGVYIVTFTEPGLLNNNGQNRSFAATSPSATGTRKLNTRSAAASSYREFLRAQQDSYLSQMTSVLGRSVVVTHRYDITLNGMAIRLNSEQEAAKLRAISGVVKVEAETVEQMTTDAGPGFIGAPSIWSGVGVSNGAGSRGQGIVVGVFDSGGNSDHPSFANDPSCGFSLANPKLLATKDCNTTNCASGNGEDVSFNDSANNPDNTGSFGHGVHTASTAVGNAIAAGTLVNGIPARFNISGVAPCAKVISYKVCGTTGPSGIAGCPGSAIQQAINTSIADQVDIVNFSISGGTSPWADNDRGFLDMVNADILVAASAGNTRTAAPNPVGAVNHRGPWVLTVANSSHDRVVTNPVSMTGSLQNVVSLIGSSAGSVPLNASITAPVASALNLGNEYGCTTPGPVFPPNSMQGRVALIQRGPPAPGVACGFVEKINNAAAAGAIAIVIYDRTTGSPLSMDLSAGVTIPAVFIRQAAGYALRDFAIANPNANLTISAPQQRIIDSNVGDILNGSSLRGPNASFDVTKPDITGPGTNIYAASSDTFGQCIFLTGTSMSGPHLAGAAALIRAIQPSWTPIEVKSAMQLTSVESGRIQDEVTPWNVDDVGNGRVNLLKAGNSSLVMNETFANFLAANNVPQNVRQLNLPSMRNTQMAGSYVFTRTVRNTRTQPIAWTVDASAVPAGASVSVSPTNFSFNGGLAETQVLQITVTMTTASATPKFGDIKLNGVQVLPSDVLFRDGFEDPIVIPTARMTIAVQGNL